MFRIDHPSRVPALPAPAVLGSPGFFTKGDASTATPATHVSADWLNATQEELSNAIESQGIALDKGDRFQLSKALLKLAGGGGNFLINAEGTIQQRTFATTAATVGVATESVGLDHWWARVGGTGDVGQISGVQDGGAGLAGFPSRPRGHLRFQKTTNNATGANPTLRQSIEGVQPLSGLPVVLAFDGKKASGADLAITAVEVEQNFGTSGSASIFTSLTSVAAGPTIDGTPRRFVFAGTLPDITGKTIGVKNHLKVRVKFATNQTFDVFLTAFVFCRGAQDPGYLPRGTAAEVYSCLRFCERNPATIANVEPLEVGLWDTAFSLSAGDVETLKRRLLVPKFSPGSSTMIWFAHDGTANAITEGASTVRAVTNAGLPGTDTGYPRITTPPAGGTLRFFRASWLLTSEIPDAP